MNILNGDFILERAFFDQTESNQIFSELKENIPWKQESLSRYGKKILVPRLTSYYGEKSYVYNGLKREVKPFNPCLLNIKEKVEFKLEKKFNAVLLNYYRTGKDSIAWHSDKNRKFKPPVASVSFGQTRRFEFRRKDNHKKKIKLDLAHGDLLVMTKENQKF